MNDEGKTESKIDLLAAALVKAQAAIPEIKRTTTVTVRTKTGGSYEFKYAPFEGVVAAIRAPLSTNGLAFIQTLTGHSYAADGRAYVRTILLHSSGQQFVSGGTPVLVGAAADPQAYGSALTYAKRYDLSLTLGLATEDDDDGAGAAGKGEGKGKGTGAGNQNGDAPLDEKFHTSLQLAAKEGLEKLRETWGSGSAAQRKNLRAKLADLKIVAQGYDDAASNAGS